jgi:hypothetical protein
MSTTTYIRQTDAGNGEIRQTVLGNAPSKHVQAEVDEMVRKRLDGKAANATSGNVVEVTAVSSDVRFKDGVDISVGQKFPSARAAMRAMGLPLHTLTVAFHRSKFKTVTLNGVTFKKHSRS